MNSSIKKKPEAEKEESSELVTEYPITVHRAIKDIKILDEDGNATVRWQRECRNRCEKEIPKLVHETEYDGFLEALEVKVNDRKADFEVERFITKKKVDGEETDRLAHKVKLRINLRKEKIRAGQFFRYDYTLSYREVFKDMYKGTRAEWTGYHVLVPTDSLTIVMTTPSGSKFVPGDLEVRVEGLYEIEDFREEQRCKEQYPPILLQEEDLVMWEIKKPKIACTYILYFSVVKTDTPQ